MFRELFLVSILKPFWRRLVRLFDTAPSKRMQRQNIHRWPGVTLQIAFSSKRKIPNCNKTNITVKPNKIHSKYLCFGGRKTREERKIRLKIRLFGFPQRLVIGSGTTAACKGVSSSTLIGAFQFERERERPLNLSARLNSNGPIRVEDETTLQAAVVADPITSLWGKPKRQILRDLVV